jgi:hypothetical protein
MDDLRRRVPDTLLGFGLASRAARAFSNSICSSSLTSLIADRAFSLSIAVAASISTCFSFACWAAFSMAACFLLLGGLETLDGEAWLLVGLHHLQQQLLACLAALCVELVLTWVLRVPVVNEEHLV